MFLAGQPTSGGVPTWLVVLPCTVLVTFIVMVVFVVLYVKSIMKRRFEESHSADDNVSGDTLVQRFLGAHSRRQVNLPPPQPFRKREGRDTPIRELGIEPFNREVVHYPPYESVVRELCWLLSPLL